MSGFAEVEALVVRAALVMVNGLWQGALVALALGVCLKLIRGLAPARRFLLWSAAFCLALVLPVVTSAARAGTAVTLVHASTGWAWLFAAAWAGIAAIRLARLAVQARMLRQTWLGAHPVVADPAIARLLSAQPRHPELCTSSAVDAPSVLGFFAPRLLVPEALMEQLSIDELRQIVLHECEHLRRYDDWLNLLQKLALALFPLNPALVWVDRQLGLERELACDAGVVGKTGAPLAYAASLTRLAEHRLGTGRLALALSAWERRSELGRRVVALIAPARGSSALRVRLVSGALGAAMAAGLIALIHAPAIVSFGGSPVVAQTTLQEPAGAGVQLVSAVIPAGGRPLARPAEVERAHARLARVSSRRRAYRVLVPQASPRFLQTRSPRIAAHGYFVPVQFLPSYAAFPFGDGWLIVQL